MNSEVADAGVTASENNDVADNLGFDSFVTARLAKPEETPETPAEPEQPEEETQPEGTEAEAEQEGIAEDEVPDNQFDLSQLNLEGLDAEQVAVLAEQMKEHLSGSRSAERIGELTRKLKAEREARQLDQQRLNDLAEKKNPLERDAPVENNPFKDIETVQDLQDKYDEYGKTYKWADRLLEDNEGAHPDDVIFEDGNEQYTKKQIREAKRQAEESRETYLPARAKELQMAQQIETQKSHFADLAKQELNWLEGEDNDSRKQYEAIVGHPDVQKIAEAVPAVSPQLNYLIAHAVNSLMSQKAKPAKKVAPSKTPPPNIPSSTAQAPVRDDERIKKHLNDLQGRFEQSHSTGDFESLRAAQYAKRYK